jgi:hypothetical protein
MQANKKSPNDATNIGRANQSTVRSSQVVNQNSTAAADPAVSATTPQRARREQYLRSAGRYAQLRLEGYIAFEVLDGGRDKSPYTPMEELDQLCREQPEDDQPIDASDLVPEGDDRDQRIDAVRRMRTRGMQTSEIATALGIPGSTVRGILRTIGMTRARRSNAWA